MTTLDIAPGALRPAGPITSAAEGGPARLYSRAEVRTAIEDGATLTADEAHISCYADRFAWPVAAAMVLLDRPNAAWGDVRNLRFGSATGSATPEDDEEPKFTRDQVSQAVNNGVDWAAGRMLRRVADDVDNFIVNAAMTLLDDPDADFYKVVRECYCESPRTVRAWLRS
ncbi:hypothetical protein [Streptomyces boncukensis]|uniref:Uncharacterized protein n=1 Tax=Streptomyces boncukensis TaxID=2711219 RepID=A0A6G4WQV5_9ACTN|nr:hypothetical protein [Streptomyces boncukensis]NGO67007.1 hypothetical protein [Streptomyces boncukensis]